MNKVVHTESLYGSISPSTLWEISVRMTEFYTRTEKTPHFAGFSINQVRKRISGISHFVEHRKRPLSDENKAV